MDRTELGAEPAAPMIDDAALNAWFCGQVLPLEPALTSFIRSNWRIAEENFQHKKTEAQRMEYQVTVPADGEQVVTYTVHYTW